jgi:hypothetical protein
VLGFSGDGSVNGYYPRVGTELGKGVYYKPPYVIKWIFPGFWQIQTEDGTAWWIQNAAAGEAYPWLVRWWVNTTHGQSPCIWQAGSIDAAVGINAGTVGCNGTYVRDGEFNNRPKYTLDAFFDLVYDPINFWNVREISSGNAFYQDADGGAAQYALPWLVFGYDAIGGNPPNIEISQEV